MSNAFLPSVGSSRVENIKKRFETNTSPSGSESVSPRFSPERCGPTVASHNSSPAEPVLRPSYAVKKVSPAIRNRISSQSPSRLKGNTRTTSPARFPIKYDRQVSGSSSSRGNNVKRSPAFRCDKIVKGRNVVGNARLSGDRPRSYTENNSQSRDTLGNNSNIKRLNSSPTKPTESIQKRQTSSGVEREPSDPDELSSVFSQRNLKSSCKPIVPSTNPKPEILQKPKLNITGPISPRVERFSPSKPNPTNISPNFQPTKPNLSTNRPRPNPAEYAIVEKRIKHSEASETRSSPTKGDGDGPVARHRPRPSPNNKPALDFYSKNLNTMPDSPPGTKDLITKTAQFNTSVQNSETGSERFASGEQTNNSMGVCDDKPRLNDDVTESVQEDSRLGQGVGLGKLQLTNTLKKALSSPLPAGPPPKKPPRTFAHLGVTPSKSSVLERVQRINDTSDQSASASSMLVSHDNDLQSNSSAREDLIRTSVTNPGVYGKTRRLPQGTAQITNATKNNSPNNSFSNLNAPNDMRSIRNIFPTGKSTENLSVPFKMNRNDLGPKKQNLDMLSSLNDRITTKPVRSRTESEIMLKKLENVLQNHQNGVVVLRPKSPCSPRRLVDKATGPISQNFDRLNMNVGYSSVRPLPIVPRDKKTTSIQNSESNKLFGGCLESISCVGIDPLYARTSNFYEKLNAKNSEFFVTGYTDLVSNQEELAQPKDKIHSDLRKSSSAEHIYAEPFEFLRKSSAGLTTHSLETKPRFNGNKVPVLAVTSDKIVEIGHFRDRTKPSTNFIVTTPVCDTSVPNIEIVGDRNGSDALHYLCTPINTDNPMEKEAPSEIEAPRPDEEVLTEGKGSVPALLRLAALVKGGQGTSEGGAPLNQNKIQYLMNQAFSLAALPLDGSDSDTPSTPEEPVAPGPDFGAHQLLPTSQTVSDPEPERDMSQLTERRKRYVRKVSCLVMPRTPRDYPHLFQYLLLVGLTLHPERRACKPYVKWKYPPDAEVTPHIEDLCFPDASDWPRPASGEQSYSLVITNEHGERMFGYCRRVMPEGMDVCLPLAYCIISPVRATGFYYKVLSELESRHGQPEILITAFISELYNSQVPGPGQALKPSFPAINHPNTARTGLKHSRTIVRRPLDLRLEERDLTQLFSSLCVPTLMQVFSSLLLERKVVLFSASLGKLSSCVEALQSILYPFSWQHTFIPVLPNSQLELCDAPTPYIFGVLKDKDGRPPHLSITDGIAVDLDTGHLVSKEGDESSILPTRLKRCLKMALQLVSATTQPGDAARNVLVSEAFIRAFVEVCGHYERHVATGPDGRRSFEREAFVRAAEDPTTRDFLEWFSETAMFHAFIESRLEGGSRARGMFEQRATEHSEVVHKNTALFLKNSRLINTRLKTLGDRFKDWTPFN